MGSLDQVAASHIILFDGVCNLCNGWVKFVLKRDPKGKFHFAPLQSAAGRRQLIRFNLDPESVYSIILIKDDALKHKSDAVLEIFQGIGNIWSLLFAFKVLPRFTRDWIYDVVARNRYRLFGRQESCMIPTAEIKSRFLE